MLGKKMEQALNDQINEEYFSSYLYLSMAAYFEAENLPGFARWMQLQSQEELAHAMKFFAYINERGGRVTLKAIKTPEKSWKSPLDIFQAAYKHEQHITGCINQLVDLAIKEKDHATNSMLKWFVDEQVEEEANASAIVDKLKLAKGAAGALFMLDRELGGRK